MAARPISSARPTFATPHATSCVIGQTVSKESVRRRQIPIGNNHPHQKHAVPESSASLAAKGQSLDGRDQDDTVLVPITTAQSKLFGNPYPGTVRFISVQAKSAERMDEAEEDMKQLLRQRHRIQPGADDDFTVRNLAAAAQRARRRRHRRCR